MDIQFDSIFVFFKKIASIPFLTIIRLQKEGLNSHIIKLETWRKYMKYPFTEFVGGQVWSL